MWKLAYVFFAFLSARLEIHLLCLAAFWEFGDPWPITGEVDIIEGANGVGATAYSLHTGNACTQPNRGRDMLGHVDGTDCFAATDDSAGCNVVDPLKSSFGKEFNEAGGGWYAMERTETSIKLWFWPRDAKNVPDDVRSGSGTVSPSGWGKPSGAFVNDDVSPKLVYFCWKMSDADCSATSARTLDRTKSSSTTPTVSQRPVLSIAC